MHQQARAAETSSFDAARLEHQTNRATVVEERPIPGKSPIGRLDINECAVTFPSAVKLGKSGKSFA